MRCERCPCPDACLGWSIFCVWAAKEPPNPVELAHIVARSAMGSLRSVDDILSDARAEGIPESIPQRRGCCG